MSGKRFGMYQNTLYDDGNILNPFSAMKLLNHFDKKNTELKKENEQLKEKIKGFESCSHNWSILYDEAKNKVEVLSKENKILKSLLYKMADRNSEIWLDDGRIYRLKKVLKGKLERFEND